MDTQNTPIHIKLWHREFWLMAIANLLVTMSLYMQIPAIPPHLLIEGYSPLQAGFSMGVFGLGIFLFGPFVSYLIQKHRRNRVCCSSIFGIVATIIMLRYIDVLNLGAFEYLLLLAIRFLMGAFFGLAQMTLSSTLIIDTCESFQRTEANHSAAWFSRFALSLGPCLSLILYHSFHSYEIVLWVSASLSALAYIMISIVKFPFKAPDDNIKVVSLDRFFMPQGKWLFINLMLITTVVGLLLSLPHADQFFTMIMVGFIFALLAEKFAFANADLRSEVITGIISIATALLIHTYTRDQSGIIYIAPVLVGFGLGIIGSRFLLFFIKLADHCQRGTSQSTYFLGWEAGISLGLFLGIGLLREPILIASKANIELIDNQQIKLAMIISLIFLLVSLIIYHLFVHNWFVKNRNR